ncbi:hypothetical protein SAMN05880501_10653 [Ureibacillus xyleni]|uniref:Uncharacterized protein n=1 Tax=Ureibacillus xyleni TaxID=614648 RepID=A0A285SRN7_9BACL|nr:hypothetical protein [Ureibacillus xyleni]SOC10896.1 hypothetical protein SAMN05880501_10653 [Ureibacillus xyleni]
MGNIYSAQNFAAYFIYELNEQRIFINSDAIQHLLADIESLWQKEFGHSAFSENIYSFNQNGYIVKEVKEAYVEYGANHIDVPAKDWELEFGQFQLVYRTYGIPSFTNEEEALVKESISKYKTSLIRKVS